ncbi:MAG TPA: hypothetical protein VL793_15475 [Patescibacteria group bacterium]|jgi:hypothetical protein|nr:hypothetical protein [Patescibacteria group bacterium]
MYLIQILLPLNDNSGKPLPPKFYGGIKDELTRRFKGLTAYTRAPAEGIWKPRKGTRRDEIVVYEVMVPRLQRKWWGEYRARLEQQFHQESIVIRAQAIVLL